MVSLERTSVGPLPVPQPCRASNAPTRLATGSLATNMDDQRKGEVRKVPAGVLKARQQQRVNAKNDAGPQLKERMWPSTLMVLGIFSVIFTLAWTGRRTLISIEMLARALALFCVIGTLVPYAWSGLRF